MSHKTKVKMSVSTNRNLSQGKHYHALIIYNYARTRIAETEDTILSKEIAEAISAKLHTWGYTRSYYHDRDALPGRNVFTELFRTIKLSQWVIVIFTKGFVRNCWSQYTQMAAFKKLIDQGNTDSSSHSVAAACSFIPVYVDLSENDIPNNLCIHEVLSFDNSSWRDDSSTEWIKLQRTLDSQPISETQQNVQIPRPSQTVTPAQNIQSERGNPVDTTSDAALEDLSMDARVHSTGAPGIPEDTVPKDINRSSIDHFHITSASHLNSGDLETDYQSMVNQHQVSCSVRNSTSPDTSSGIGSMESASQIRNSQHHAVVKSQAGECDSQESGSVEIYSVSSTIPWNEDRSSTESKYQELDFKSLLESQSSEPLVEKQKQSVKVKVEDPKESQIIPLHNPPGLAGRMVSGFFRSLTHLVTSPESLFM